MKKLFVLTIAIVITLPAIGQNIVLQDARIDGSCEIGNTVNLYGPRAVYSHAWAQFLNGFGVAAESLMVGTHVISPNVDYSPWETQDGAYSDTRSGPWEFGQCYTASNSATAYPAGGEIPILGGTVSASFASAGQACAPEDPNAACTQTCWTTCERGQCPPLPWIPCTYCSPLVLDMRGDGIRTSGADDPIHFDVDADGTVDRIGWVVPDTDDAFLWRDVERNHRVDDGSELFGVGMTLPDGDRARNGFEALAVYDRAEHGGNGDGEITAADGIWRRLRLWRDGNHNGVSEATEISPIQGSGVVSMDLGWIESFDVDLAGNQHRMVSTYRLRVGGAPHAERALVDVFFRRY